MTKYFLNFSAITKNILKDPVFFGTFVVTVGIFVSNLFGYLLQVSLGRLLTVENFGIFTAVFALAGILAIPATALTQSLIKNFAELKAENQYGVMTQLFFKLSIYSLIFGFITFIIIYSLKDFLANYLNISEPQIFFSFGISIALSFLLVPSRSYLQGAVKFYALSFFIVFSSFVRLLFPTIFMYIGLDFTWVFWGFSLSIVVSYLASFLLIRKDFVKELNSELKPYYKKILSFGYVTLFTLIGLTLLNSVDVLLVKHFFDPLTAGQYAGVITVGKVLLFGAGAVSVLMFPQISGMYSKGQDYMPRFKQFLILQVVMVVGGVIVFWIFPEFIVRVMFGLGYVSAQIYIPAYAVFMGLYILVNFMLLFLLAINKTRVWLLLPPIILAQYILIKLNHDSLYDIIAVNIIVTTALLVGTVLYFVVSRSNKFSTAQS